MLSLTHLSSFKLSFQQYRQFASAATSAAKKKASPAIKAKLPQPERIKLPPRPKNAYQFYMVEHLNDYKTDGKIDIVKATKDLGAKWRMMSEQEKKSFEAEAEKARAKYKKELDALYSRLTPADFARENEYRSLLRKSGKKDLPPLHDPSRPKRPLSGYMYFYQQLRSTAEGQEQLARAGKVAEQAKFAGEKWRKLSDEEKRPFLNKASADLERYNKEMAKYREKMIRH
ncbi:uncharacterized protein VTP21DRAFT_3464 [Calcarisporiella thermophila]|uniref:uncharacterized protein n=1 Tax=Calcarisporiella thermophila TaxID=911321 RepID=UPI00374357E9